MEQPKDIAARIRPFLAAMERSIDSARGRRTSELRPSKPPTLAPAQPLMPPPQSGLAGTASTAPAASTKLKARRKDSLTPFGPSFSTVPGAQRRAV
jgi:hypothetical protein